MTKDELVDFFKEQIELEHRIIKSIRDSLRTVRNPVVKQVLSAISLDSQKHVGMYKAAMSISAVTPALTDEEYRELERITAKHIKDEEKAIATLGEMAPKLKDEKVRLLLESIAADERKHHELLKKVIELVVRKEAITEEDWWEILWKNVPFHGAPGG